MGQFLLLLVVALTVAAVVFGVTVLVSGGDPGLVPAEPDGRSVPLPGTRPLQETDVTGVRFDTGLRGYRMAQVDQALRRAAYDIGYKDELIGVLEAEVTALREGRAADAETLRRAREAALVPAAAAAAEASGAAGTRLPGAGAEAADGAPAGDEARPAPEVTVSAVDGEKTPASPVGPDGPAKDAASDAAVPNGSASDVAPPRAGKSDAERG